MFQQILLLLVAPLSFFLIGYWGSLLFIRYANSQQKFQMALVSSFLGGTRKIADELAKKSPPPVARILAYGPDGIAVVRELPEAGSQLRVSVRINRKGPARVVWLCENCYVQSVVYGTDLIRIESVGVSESIHDASPGLDFHLEVIANAAL